MPIRATENLFGAWAFLVGVVLSIAAGVLSFGELNAVVLGILVLLGLVVGFLSVSEKEEVRTFLMAAVSLSIVSFAGISSIAGAEIIGIQLGSYVNSTLGGLLVMLVPATIVVAIKSLFTLAQR